jgi:hypothetical protein
MPGTTEKNKIKNNVKVPAAPALKTYKTKAATDAQMKAAKESISKGDKKAIKKSDLKGGLKRQAKRSAGEAKRDIAKKARLKERDTNKKERTAKKESIKAAGSRKAARLLDKSDAAKKAEKASLKEYNTAIDAGTRGKEFLKNAKNTAKSEIKTDRIDKRLTKEQKKVVEKGQKKDAKQSKKDTKIANKKIGADIKKKDKNKTKSQKNQLASSGSTDTKIKGTMRGSVAKNMESYDQMDTVNAKSTAKMYSADGPIKYFKQSIKYNNSAKATAIKVAADEKDMAHASPKGKKELKHDVSSMINHAAPSAMNKPVTYMKGSIKKRPSFMERMTKNSK